MYRLYAVYFPAALYCQRRDGEDCDGDGREQLPSIVGRLDSVVKQGAVNSTTRFTILKRPVPEFNAAC